MASNFDITKIDSSVLENYRKETDPLADSTVTKIIDSGYEKQINEIMMTLFRNSSFKKGMFSSLGSELSSILDDYLETSGRLPEWAELSKIEEGEKVFSMYGPEIFMLLNVSSLPMCYTCGKGAQVLYETGRLLSHNNDIDPLARRLMETGQMVFNVLSSGGLAPGGSGLITLQKVRLIHASIRYYLKHKEYNDQPWEVAHFGEPINQEDLTGTLMSFGPVILTGLKKLNIGLSDSQIESYMHCWKVVGYAMGINEQLLPDTYEDGFNLATKILEDQAIESEAGKALTKSCLEFINYVMPGNAFNDVPRYMMDYFLQDFADSSGKDLSKFIGVDGAADWKDKIVLKLSSFLIGEISHLEHSKLIQKLSGSFNRLLLQGIIHHFNDGKGVQFNIPPSLQKDWGLVETWKDYRSLSPNLFGNRLEWQKKSENIK